MSQPDSADDRLLSAERLIGEFYARCADGEEADFDSLVRAYPHLEIELREMHAAAAAVDGALGKGRAEFSAEQERVADILKRIRSDVDTTSRYAFEGEVGKGGMGIVYRVRDTKLDRSLAMKVIRGQVDVLPTGKTPPIPARQLARFVNEAKITGQLDHPGIVPVHEVGVDQEDRAFFTMKLVKGITLADVFKRRAADDPEWSMARVLGVIQRVCEAMAFAHDRGVIHRDLKPANIMVGDFGEVYVMDWGLARRTGDPGDVPEERATGDADAAIDAQLGEQISLTRDGAVIGTPSFMSPEQARGEIEAMGPQSDVYAIGAMLYQLIAGVPPYVKKGERASGSEIMARVVTGPPKRLESKSTPPELIAICEQAMRHDQAARYENVRELGTDLQRFLGGHTVKALKTGAWVETKKWVQRNRALASALAGVLVVAVAGGLAFASKARSEREARKEAVRNALESQASAARAQEQEHIAKASEARANEKEHEATQKSNDVLSLSAIQDLKELVAEADDLWPAGPIMITRYEHWLEKARLLIEGQPPDPVHAIKGTVGLRQHKAKLAEIRARAQPRPAADSMGELQAHPQFAQWTAKQAQLHWLSRMLGLEPWPNEAEIEIALASETLPSSSRKLRDLAWSLVNPDKPVYGQEVRALLLARRALDAASASDRAERRDVLEWALFRVGKFDEALKQAELAAEEIGAEKREQYKELVAKWLAVAIARWEGATARAERRKERDDLAREVEVLNRAVNPPRNPTFDDREDGWWYSQLSMLVADLEALEDPEVGLLSNGISREHGWCMRKRYEFARSIEDLSISGVDARRRWEEAITAIAKSPKYGGLKLTPQIGLLPIGEDPNSQLWEFAHLQTGNEVQHSTDRKLVPDAGMGLVFVLIPGGTFWMGAQNVNPGRPNYDKQAKANESPEHQVTLAPYFLSKYEMTQGQWSRFMGCNLSQYDPNTRAGDHQITLLHPVESVSWTECMVAMARLGLTLPSEAQWENGCRGGKETPWWTGAERESLRGQVNLADQSAGKAGSSWQDIKDWPDVEDGWAVHAPVGTFAANAFGLHEVAGNVWEWCLDGWDGSPYEGGATHDPVAPSAGAKRRVNRGGSFVNAASSLRSAQRILAAPDFQNVALGLRPARLVTP